MKNIQNFDSFIIEGLTLRKFKKIKEYAKDWLPDLKSRLEDIEVAWGPEMSNMEEHVDAALDNYDVEHRDFKIIDD